MVNAQTLNDVVKYRKRRLSRSKRQLAFIAWLCSNLPPGVANKDLIKWMSILHSGCTPADEKLIADFVRDRPAMLRALKRPGKLF